MPREELQIEIKDAHVGMRLDRLIRMLMPQMPLSAIHKMLRGRDVRLDGKRAKGPTRIELGQMLTLRLTPFDAEAVRRNIKRRAYSPDKTAISLEVLYRDADIMVFNKPSGVATQPGDAHSKENTVVGALRALAGDTEGIFKPSPVGRLDRDTSGVQLAGISPSGVRGLNKLMRAREISKTYLALVRGAELPQKGEITTPLFDSGMRNTRMRPTTIDADGAYECLTRFELLGQTPEASLVRVMPKTGRRHQIRAHFLSIGAPLAGDVRYGNRAWNAYLAQNNILTRLFLHAATSQFEHPVTGEKICVKAPLASELKDTLTAFGIDVSDDLL